MSKNDRSSPDLDRTSSSGNDDGLSALQLPFLQSHEMSKYLNSSKEWLSDDPQEIDIMEYVITFHPIGIVAAFVWHVLWADWPVVNHLVQNLQC